MRVHIRRFPPVQAGKILAALFALMCLPMIPITAFISLLGPGDFPFPWSNPISAVLLIPLYATLGFLNGALFAVAYNFVAARLGGVEMEVKGASRDRTE